MNRRPDFVIIGAMKCATSTLHVQLAAQPGFFMSNPKEPNFFSDDDNYARGLDWYWALFAGAPEGSLCGESSTHYTKLPTCPHTIERMKAALPELKLIYVMREPISRLLSQYIHEWTENRIRGRPDVAVRQFPTLVDYGRYSMQMEPFFHAYGPASILPVFFERLVAQPTTELERVCRFLGYRGPVAWQQEKTQDNVSARRLKKSPLRDLIVNQPVLASIRRRFIPQGVRDRIKSLWQMKERPRLTVAETQRLTRIYDEDLARLGSWLGLDLRCDTFKEVAQATEAHWTEETLAGGWKNWEPAGLSTGGARRRTG